ncbi:PH domain-containing protein [Kitasatospora aureofaciens]|uniref:PH domain-containing protein n=1 Tax=Kitasatospora aureofaciens TaxID=1894 RepID=UPI003407CD2E
MNELIFRGKDLFRPSWSNFLPLLLVLTAQLVFGGMNLGAWPTFWMVLVTVALCVPAAVLSWRSWSRVGADGVSVCWGFGRGRTYPWQEIRWVDVRETRSNGSMAYAARVFLTDGRRRSLPGLQSSRLYPSADFDTDFQRLVNWWEYSTHPTQRVKPAKRLRDRVTPTVAGVLLGFLTSAVILVVVILQQP